MPENLIKEIPQNWSNVDMERRVHSEMGEMGVTQLYERVIALRKEWNLYPESGFLDSESFGNLGIAKFELSSGDPNTLQILTRLNFLSSELQSISKDLLIEDRENNYCDIYVITKRRLTKTLNLNSIGENSSTQKIGLLEKQCLSLRPYILTKFERKINRHPREQDTEFKFLEYFLIQIQEAGITQKNFDKITGGLDIFTERKVCESCSNVIARFCQLFPNINLKTVAGLGKNYDYSKKAQY